MFLLCIAFLLFVALAPSWQAAQPIEEAHNSDYKTVVNLFKLSGISLEVIKEINGKDQLVKKHSDEKK